MGDLMERGTDDECIGREHALSTAHANSASITSSFLRGVLSILYDVKLFSSRDCVLMWIRRRSSVRAVGRR